MKAELGHHVHLHGRVPAGVVDGASMNLFDGHDVGTLERIAIRFSKG